MRGLARARPGDRALLGREEAPLPQADAGAELPFIIRSAAWTGAGLLCAMLLMFLLTGVAQEGLRTFRPPVAYAAFLLRDPVRFRGVLALDTLFVFAYVTAFVALTAWLAEPGRPRALLALSAACMISAGALDLGENLHFLVALAAAEHGVALSPAQIELQLWASLLEFHLAYFGLSLLGFNLPREGRAMRALAFTCSWVNPPVGVLIYVLPAVLARALLFARFAILVYALLAIGWLFGAPRRAVAPSPGP